MILDIDSASTGFAAVGSAPRLQVLTLLVRAGLSGMSTSDIQLKTGIPASTLTHHLKHLADGGVIRQVKQGRTMISIANYKQLKALAGFLLDECCADAPEDIGKGDEDE